MLISLRLIGFKRTSLKEIKFRPSTDTGDYNIKLKKKKSFILNGDKTKISVRFRGREILNSNLGLELLKDSRMSCRNSSSRSRAIIRRQTVINGSVTFKKE